MRVKNGDVRYLALLRGINVGGRNMVKMPDLRSCFGRLGFNNVTTYIQSGNVLFDCRLKGPSRLAVVIEEALAAELSCTPAVVIVSEEQLARVVRQAPPAFGTDPVAYRYDVVFLRPPVRARDVLPTVSIKAGVDEAFEANEVLYLKKLKARASQSHFPKLVGSAAYKSMTVRSWYTTTELYRLISSSQ